jgi:cytochrome b6-f complex iron-sulfur subunit
MSCTRRVVLQTIGVGTVGCVMPACGGEDDPGAPLGKAEICGRDLCLTIAENPELAVVGGIVFFSQVAGKPVFVTRVSETEFRALSARCTHQGCTVAWDGAEKFVCPCHGSQFGPTGSVMKSPAAAALVTYPTTFANDQLTILL